MKDKEMATRESERSRYTYQIRIVSNRGFDSDALYSDGMYLHSTRPFAGVVEVISRYGFWTNWAGDNRVFPDLASRAGMTWIAPGAILWIKLARDRGEQWEKGR